MALRFPVGMNPYWDTQWRRIGFWFYDFAPDWAAGFLGLDMAHVFMRVVCVFYGHEAYDWTRRPTACVYCNGRMW